MVADPFRRSNGDRASPSCLTALRATCIGIVVSTLASCAKDVQQHADRVAERLLPIPRVKVAGGLKLSQAEFAAKFGIPAATIRDLEQNRRKPEGAARVLLKVIQEEPEAVSRALAHV